MPNTLGRNLNLCFTKITRPLTLHSPDNDHSRPLPTTAADAATATTSTSSTSLMIKNFNSLYDDQYMFDSTTTSKSLSSSVSSSETDTDAPAADFATAFASRRFFFSSPGLSNSIVDQSASSPSSIAASSESPDHKLVNHSVAVPTFSPDPYRDFRRSMQEMVEAREGMKTRRRRRARRRNQTGNSCMSFCCAILRSTLRAPTSSSLALLLIFSSASCHLPVGVTAENYRSSQLASVRFHGASEIK
ncbi:transcription repressor OFP12 [Prunus yedoensis var. nudiflora]|uniref:Transcription repressor n=1 Tax=Prunus yedoensis var. nudiflora TaxID=2094558 RepID=A0A314XT14_PRUYE|nr:transcription repressor OFP12 [Prunus yedoensis var. nudiflora]